MTAWVFAYGSLLFRPDLPGSPAPRVAFVRDWQRRFDQGSPDHRGTPENLGRVATLVPAPGAMCLGAVFEIVGPDAEATLAMLDHRERGGYVRMEIEATLRDEPRRVVMATTWIAPAGNPFALGPTSRDAMVEQIARAVGPSGSNVDYVLRLAEALRGWNIADDHVFDLERALRDITGTMKT